MAGRRRKLKAEEAAEAIRQAGGISSIAAKNLGVSPQTVQRYARDYQSCADAQEQARQHNLDLAETKLLANIRDGNMTAIIFYLKTQGKDRGYSERVESTGKDGGPVEVSDAKAKLLDGLAASPDAAE